MANIATSNITSGSSVVAGSSFATASVTPTSGRVCLLLVAAGGGADPNTPTVTGASVTWTQVATVGINGFVRLTLFRVYSTSPGTGVLTIDFAGQSQDRCAWILDDFTNTRVTGTNGANAIVQSATNSGAAASTLAATLAAFANSANATYGGDVTQNATLRTIAAGSGFTETVETDTADFMALASMFRLDNSTTVDFTASGVASHLGVIGVELANVSTEGSPSASASASKSPSASQSPSSSASKSASASASSSASKSQSPSSSASRSQSPSSSSSASVSPSSSTSSSPSPGFEDYTREQNLVLPTNNNDLSTIYTEQEKTDVSTYDGVRVGQVGDQKYMIHQFKVFVGNVINDPTVLWKGQSTLSPVLSTIYLQIYNNNSGWETLDSNNSGSAFTDIRLAGDILDFTDYKDHDQVVSCRVYQLAI